jgi:hypothetical protein
MYKLLGLSPSLRNIVCLARPFLRGEGKDHLGRAYRAFLQARYPDLTISAYPGMALLSEAQDVRPYLDIFEIDSVLDDLDEFHGFLENGTRSRDVLKRIQAAIQQLATEAPGFAGLLELVVYTIFTAPSSLAGGGSTSALIGCIWADLRAHWEDQDIQEFLIHETTHNLVFLDELCYGHYSDYAALSDVKNFAQSAILARPRPLDKVLHSILVSVEILVFREHLLGHPIRPFLHPPSEILLAQTAESVNSVLNNPGSRGLLTSRGHHLLEESQKVLADLSVEILNEV